MKFQHPKTFHIFAVLVIAGCGRAEKLDPSRPPQEVPPLTLSNSPSQSVVTLGPNHACILTTDHAVRCWGENEFGQLGKSSPERWESPEAVPNLPKTMSAVTTSLNHTCAIGSNQELFCWGANEAGQLGTGSTSEKEAPSRVESLKATQVVLGNAHTCALTPDQKVFCWGENWFGQLGTGTKEPTSTPTEVKGLDSVVSLTAGSMHTCALSSSGKVLCWGKGDFGQLGNGSRSLQPTPHPVALSSPVSQLAAGSNHTCAVDTGGQAWCWGKNEFGQLGTGTTLLSTEPQPVRDLEKVTHISPGYQHTCASFQGGKLACWGWNTMGQLGVPQAVSEQTGSQFSSPRLARAGASFKFSAAGWYQTCAVNPYNHFSCWGVGVPIEFLGASTP